MYIRNNVNATVYYFKTYDNYRTLDCYEFSDSPTSVKINILYINKHFYNITDYDKFQECVINVEIRKCEKCNEFSSDSNIVFKRHFERCKKQKYKLPKKELIMEENSKFYTNLSKKENNKDKKTYLIIADCESILTEPTLKNSTKTFYIKTHVCSYVGFIILDITNEEPKIVKLEGFEDDDFGFFF